MKHSAEFLEATYRICGASQVPERARLQAHGGLGGACFGHAARPLSATAVRKHAQGGWHFFEKEELHAPVWKPSWH